MMIDFEKDKRFTGLQPLKNRVWLASPTMHGDERMYVDEAFDTNWVTTAGDNITAIEEKIADFIGCKYAVALSSGTSALHMAIRLAGERLYGQAKPNEGTLVGKKVFCSDMTFDASVNPVAYEGGEAIFIDTETDTWNMDPRALRIAFEKYPEVKLIVIAHLYGTPAKMDEIRAIADEYGALLVEDAAESLGARYSSTSGYIETGSWGDFNAISFNGNKIITGSSGGMFLTNSKEDADKVRKWSTQSRDPAPWYQHTEIGYNYRMSNIIAGIVRGQLPHIDEHITQKKEIYERYRDGLSDLPVKLNPYDKEKSIPNFWLSCMTIDSEAMGIQTRGALDYEYEAGGSGKTTPHEILDVLDCFGCEGRPIWKPMHMQPIYKNNIFITAEKVILGGAASEGLSDGTDIGADIFRRGLCLPSDIKMTAKEQKLIIDVIHRCFD